MSEPVTPSETAQAWAHEHDVTLERLAESIRRLRKALKFAKRYITQKQAREPIETALETAQNLAHWLPVLLDHPDFTPADDKELLDRLVADLDRLLDLAGMNPRTSEVARLLGHDPAPKWRPARPKNPMNKAGVFSRVMSGAFASEYWRLLDRRPTNWMDGLNSEMAGELKEFVRALCIDVGLDPKRDPARIAKRYSRRSRQNHAGK